MPTFDREDAFACCGLDVFVCVAALSSPRRAFVADAVIGSLLAAARLRVAQNVALGLLLRQRLFVSDIATRWSINYCA